MSQPDDDRELDRRIAKLPRAMDPDRDLWRDIENRIVAPRPTSFFAARKRKVAMASAVSIAAAAAVALLVAGRVRRPSWPWPSPATTAVAVNSAAPAPIVSMNPASSAAVSDVLENAKERITYRAAVLALEASLAESRGALPPEALRRIDQSLGVLDGAIEATEKALVLDPDSAELRAQLWDEYQQKIDALTAVVDLVTRAS